MDLVPVRGNGVANAATRSAVAAPRRTPVAVRAGLLPWVPVRLIIGIGGWFLLRDEPGVGLYTVLALLGGA